MITESRGQAGGLDPSDDEALWALLGRQEPPVNASPYFVRRVLRELPGVPPGGWWQRVRRVWTFAPRYTAVCSGVFALGVLCLSTVLKLPSGHPPMRRAAATTYAVEFSAPANGIPSVAAETPAWAEEAVPAQDVELIADLDNLLSREESRLWTEDDTARF